MNGKIDLRLLNEMAAIDGENPFDEIEEDTLTAEAGEKIDPVDVTEINAEQVFATTAEWKNALRLPEMETAAAHRLKALVNNFEAFSPEGSNSPTQAHPPKNTSFVEKIRQWFYPIVYPAGGVALASSLVVLFFVGADKNSPTWDTRYAELGGSQIAEPYTISSSSEFFVRPDTQIRGESPAKSQPCTNVPTRDNADECADGSAAFEREILERGIADSSYVPILRATELKGLLAARVPADGLWFLIRAELAPGETTDGANSSGCKLVEALFSNSDTPPNEEAGYFLSYCPLKWTEKLRLL